jgi:hypothetical protein
MQRQRISTTYHEFVGGHNYVCYRVSLYDRIKEVYHHPVAQLDDDTIHCSGHR